jgi:hypothetical protein
LKPTPPPVHPTQSAAAGPDDRLGAPASSGPASGTLLGDDAEEDNHIVYSTRTPNGFAYLARHDPDGRSGILGVDHVKGRRQVDLDATDPDQSVVDLSLLLRGLSVASSVADELAGLDSDASTLLRAAASFDVAYDLVSRGVSSHMAAELAIFVTAFGDRVPGSGEVTAAHGRLVSWTQTVAAQVQSSLEAEAAAIAAAEAAKSAEQISGFLPPMLRPLAAERS